MIATIQVAIMLHRRRMATHRSKRADAWRHTAPVGKRSIKQLDKHDVVFWEKHGILAVGEDLIECFDAIDTLSKSAQIYFSARLAGSEPEGMTDKQLDDLVTAFGL